MTTDGWRSRIPWTCECLDLVSEAEKNLDRDDERSRRCSAPEFPNGHSCDMGHPSSVKMIEKNLLCLSNRCGLPPCLLSKYCWFRPVCASSPAVVSVQRWSSVGWEEPPGPVWEVGCWSGGAQRRKGFYSNSYGASVPQALILFIGYHTAIPHHAIHGPCDEVRVVLPTVGGCRPCPRYSCQVDRMTTDPFMFVSG
ncbi:hypothetical protein B296_00024711 [Ensete ventricosum]|uniref:Uncharacterized protein n=1 Tax=Ensete ventricosum TaxID=4639 RepID=A0A426XR71_ENSVE|nr:hypothetical protein B296_00024711 [Ensete ventricosum]